MESKREKHLNTCNCSYDPCARKGVCCDCIAHHLKSGAPRLLFH